MKKHSKEEFNNPIPTNSTVSSNTPYSHSVENDNRMSNSQKNTKYSPMQHMGSDIISDAIVFCNLLSYYRRSIFKHNSVILILLTGRRIYGLVTQGKANQICIQKEVSALGVLEFDDRLLRRYYARLIQTGIRKISYFWTHLPKLQFISSHLAKITKQIHSIFNDIFKLKNLNQHFTVLRLLNQQNAIVQQKIYQFLIDEGYLLSMDQFYRINGVDVVSDRQYQGKGNKTEESSIQPSMQQSQQLIQSKKQSAKNIRISKVKQQIHLKQLKKSMAKKRISTIMDNSSKLSLGHLQKNKTKIKNMLQSLVKQLKSSFEQQKQTNKLQIIAEQNETGEKAEQYRITEIPLVLQQKQKVEPAHNGSSLAINFTPRRISRTQNEYRKKAIQKKMSIQLMSYFTNEFKSVISDTKQADIQNLSELLVTNSSKTKTNEQKNIQETYIHSLQSFQSINRIKQQKRRSKLIQMASKKNNPNYFDHIYNEVHDGSEGNHFYFQRRSQIGHLLENRQKKFSVCSNDGGLYISFPVRMESRFGPQNKNLTSNKRSCPNSSQNQEQIRKSNRLIIRQSNTDQDSLFQNEILINQLTPKYMSSINQTQINGNNLSTGIISQSTWRKCKEQFHQNRNQNNNYNNRFNQNQIYPAYRWIRERKKLGDLIDIQLNGKKIGKNQEGKSENQWKVQSRIQLSIALGTERQKQLIAKHKLLALKNKQNLPSSSSMKRRQSVAKTEIQKFTSRLEQQTQTVRNNEILSSRKQSLIMDQQKVKQLNEGLRDSRSRQKQNDGKNSHFGRQVHFRTGKSVNYTVYDTIRRKVIDIK